MSLPPAEEPSQPGADHVLERALPWLVAVAAVVGLTLPDPGRAVADAGGIEAVLAVLVLASGLGLAPGALHRARAAAGRVALAALVPLVALPPLAWLASRLVGDADLAHGVLALGVAPTEIAAVAITSLVSGSVAVTGTLLVASSALAVLAAGPVLALLAGTAAAPPAGILVTLLLVVALPLTAGLAARRTARGPALARLADPGAVLAVSTLVWLVASRVEPSGDLLGVVGAVLVFLLGSSALGALLARGAGADVADAVRLSVSMRDFAVAAGTATAAFGPDATGPAGVYGIAVLAFGALYARVAGPRVAAAGATGPQGRG